MARHEVYTSVDIGSRYFKGVVVEVKGDSFELLANAEVNSRGVESGDIKDISAFKEAFNHLLEELLSQYPRLAKTELLVSFSSDKFSLDDHRESFELAGEGEEEVLVTDEILEDLKYETLSRISGPEVGKKVLNMFVRRYILNGNRVVVNPVDMPARSIDMEMLSVRIDYPIGESIRATLEDITGSEPSVFASPISAAEGTLTPTEKDSGVVLVDLGYNFSTVIAYLNNIPISLEYVPIGMKNVLKDIVYVFRTSFEEAETMLRNHSSAVYNPAENSDIEIEYREIDGRTVKKISAAKFSMVVNARLVEIFNKIRRVYKNLERSVPEYRESGIPGGVVLTGGGARIRRIADLAVQVLRTNVRVGSFLTSFPVGSERAIGDEEVLGDPTFSAAFGNVVNFLKMEMEIQKPQRSKKSQSFSKALKKFLKNLF